MLVISKSLGDLFENPVNTTKSLSSSSSPRHPTKKTSPRLLQSHILFTLLLPCWKSLLTLHIANFLSTVYNVTRYFSICSYTGQSQCFANPYDSSQSVTRESLEVYEIFQNPRNKSILTQSSLPTLSPNLLFLPYSPSTTVPRDSTQNWSRHQQFPCSTIIGDSCTNLSCLSPTPFYTSWLQR